MGKFPALLLLDLLTVYQTLALNHEGKLHNERTRSSECRSKEQVGGNIVSTNV